MIITVLIKKLDHHTVHIITILQTALLNQSIVVISYYFTRLMKLKIWGGLLGGKWCTFVCVTTTCTTADTVCGELISQL
jgi:hypothetical protein